MRTPKTRSIRWPASLLLAAAFLVVFAPTTVGGATSYIIVSGSSMSPTLADGDLVVVRTGEYAVGEIVAFETGRGVVIHRIVGGSEEDGFVMQGDNKDNPDSWHPTPEDIVGKRFAQIPEAGRWVQRVTASPALLGATLGGLGSLLLWSPRRRRKRRGAHAAEARSRMQPASRVSSTRGAGTTLLTVATVTILLTGAMTYLMVRPAERIETLEPILFEHSGAFQYTAAVDHSIVYDSVTINSPPNGSEPTPIYTQLLQELQVEFDYELASQPPVGLEGILAAELRIGAGESLWTRTIQLLSPQPFEGASASAAFSVDMGRVLTLIARAEEQTGFAPSHYQLTIAVQVELVDDGEAGVETFAAELPMELRDTLLLINNELTVSETVRRSEEVLVANDFEFLGISLPLRWARAGVGAVLAMILIAGGIYAAGVRRRLGRGEVAKIRLRYGPLIVPVTGAAPNGTRPVDVSSMTDLVRLARRAEQMVFYDQRSSEDHWFFVPDGPVTYQYRLSIPEQAEE